MGLALFIGVFAAAAIAAWRGARAAQPAALIALGWLALVAGLLAAQSLVAGIPLDAIIWFAVGLAVAHSVEPAQGRPA